ncbi:hypothetical protein [Propionivibrio sp.]|uniref:hypothetical protein n=1 Tax=Propionivibrio sp. TaxID=2212460 RepID=UPI0025EB60E7|nr:hypothetical protein [Propionivibrio sp.]
MLFVPSAVHVRQEQLDGVSPGSCVDLTGRQLAFDQAFVCLGRLAYLLDNFGSKFLVVSALVAFNLEGFALAIDSAVIAILTACELR